MKRWMPVLAMLSLSVAVSSITSIQARADTRGDKRDARSKGKDAKDGKSDAMTYTGPKKTIAVQQITIDQSGSSVDGNWMPPANFGASLTDMLTTELIKNDHFQVVEREILDKIIKEWNLKGSGAVSQLGPEIGKATGAQLFITGGLTEHTYRRTNNTVHTPFGDIGDKGTEASIKMDIRLVDTTTGVVLAAVTGEGHDKSHGSLLSTDYKGYGFGNKNFRDSSLGKAIRIALDDVIKQICAACVKLDAASGLNTKAPEASIAKIDTDDAATTLYIEMNPGFTMHEGDEIDIFKQGEAIRGSSGQILGYGKSKRIGRCKIEKIQGMLATAVLTQGDGLDTGDVKNYCVRPLNSDKPKTDKTPADKTPSDKTDADKTDTDKTDQKP